MNYLAELVLNTIPAANRLTSTEEERVTFLLEQIAAKIKRRYTEKYYCININDDYEMFELVTDIASTLRLLGYRVNIENTYIEIRW